MISFRLEAVEQQDLNAPQFPEVLTQLSELKKPSAVLSEVTRVSHVEAPRVHTMTEFKEVSAVSEVSKMTEVSEVPEVSEAVDLLPDLVDQSTEFGLLDQDFGLELEETHFGPEPVEADFGPESKMDPKPA